MIRIRIPIDSKRLKVWTDRLASSFAGNTYDTSSIESFLYHLNNAIDRGEIKKTMEKICTSLKVIVQNKTKETAIVKTLLERKLLANENQK